MSGEADENWEGQLNGKLPLGIYSYSVALDCFSKQED